MGHEIQQLFYSKLGGGGGCRSGPLSRGRRDHGTLIQVGVHEGEETVALSFKLEFPCSKNTAEYEAYITGLATALEMGSNI